MAKRRVLGVVIGIARIAGWLAIAIAILSIAPIRNLMGPLSGSVSVLASVALLLGGALWLIAVEVFIKFLDQYLSRN